MNVLPIRKSDPFPSLSLADASPKYRELTERRSAMQLELEELKRNAGALNRNIAGGLHATRDVDREKEAGVARVLGSLAGDRAAPTDVENLETMRARITELEGALEAIRLDIAEARMTASSAICKAIKGHYVELAQNLAKALVAAHAASLEYQDFVDALNSESVAWAQLGPVSTDDLFGHPRDRQSDLAIWFRYAASVGLIKPSDIPEEL